MKKFILNKLLKSQTIWHYLAKLISELAAKKGLNAKIIYEIVLLFGSLVTKKPLSHLNARTLAALNKMDSSHIA